MPIPTSIDELSQTAGSNPPSGSDSPTVTDDHFRAGYSFMALLRDIKASITDVVLLTGNQTIAGVKTFSSGIVGSVSGTAANITGTAAVANGGTGATTAAAARTALGIDALVCPPGMIVPFARTTAPSGWEALPLAPATRSRTGIYTDLFAALGTTWGPGNGSTTFGFPYMPENYAPIQADGDVGTAETGEIKAHTHTMTGGTGSPSAGANAVPFSTGVAGSGGTTQSTGGAANLAAGLKFLYCVKL